MAKHMYHFKVDIKYTQFSGDVKKTKLQQITNVICALLNTKGGQLEICLDCFPKKAIHDLIRTVEQRYENIIGGLATSEKIIKQLVTLQKISLIITAMHDYLCTLSYNLFLPSTVQVQSIEPSEPIAVIERIVEGKRRDYHRVQTQLCTHYTDFSRGNEFAVACNTICKSVKEGRDVKCEMTSKQSKFKRQVSALANDCGGHIYHGINCGEVVGVIVKENEREMITSEVEKKLEKLIWGGHEKPTRGRDWDIYFEPVRDENNVIINQIFVIVVTIAPYKGGVFVMEPDCYHVVQDKVEKMSFEKWKEELLCRRTIRQCNNIDEHVTSITVPKFITFDGKKPDS